MLRLLLVGRGKAARTLLRPAISAALMKRSGQAPKNLVGGRLVGGSTATKEHVLFDCLEPF
ncbi:PREDICTED: uncharacterized protein LOC108379065 isoform X2 [Rhagoletis zephyria]|uniref:uncharacterized protein LOC108379065 isoform X2 n=1 Tax=Rhagoletis zephyria TaxID=28612 RepID=UPI0008114401|nr:PREDICTED: uncharacterized protein LOC108379065 isoform X2 [Rhagoletis zephyria]